MTEAQLQVPNREVVEARRVRENAANARILQTGWFSSFSGPAGGIPVQAWGRLSTGERVSFRARNTEAVLTITHDGKSPQTFSKVLGDTWQCAGLMEPDAAAQLIVEWIDAYRNS